MNGIRIVRRYLFLSHLSVRAPADPGRGIVIRDESTPHFVALGPGQLGVMADDLTLGDAAKVEHHGVFVGKILNL